MALLDDTAPVAPLENLFNAISTQTAADIIAAKDADTGWVAIPVASGYTTDAGSGTPQSRKIGKQVWFRGGFAVTAGGNFPTDSLTVLVGTLAVGHRPVAPTRRVGIQGSNGNNDGNLLIAADGTLTIRTGTAATTYFVLPTGSFLID